MDVEGIILSKVKSEREKQILLEFYVDYKK